MPTPDKTIDVSKLVIEARQLASIHASYTFAGGDIGYVVKDRFITAIRALCDALESVAKENAESEKRAELWKHNAEVWKSNHDSALVELADMRKERNTLRGQLAAVANERDALLKQCVCECGQKMSHICENDAHVSAALASRATPQEPKDGD